MTDRKQKKTYIIGTRGSHLALAQCSLLQQELQKKTNLNFEIKIIKTTGDKITDRPLWQLEGKDFFTKELDQALLAKEIDLVIHSYKDLGSDRPKEFKLAAISKRSFPHDILLMRRESILQLQRNPARTKLIIGTSSPRRIFLLKNYLRHYLPFASAIQPDQIEWQYLRGNVNSRLDKLLPHKASPNKLQKSATSTPPLDGIVLALAGLERLCTHKDYRSRFDHYWDELDFKILPLSIFPCAPAQGALAIECLAERQELMEALKLVHDSESSHSIAKERKFFQQFGGGCHLALGAYCTPKEDWSFVDGEVDGQKVSMPALIDQQGILMQKWQSLCSGSETMRCFIGLSAQRLLQNFATLKTETIHLIPDEAFLKNPLSVEFKKEFQSTFEHKKLFFVTSVHCLKTLKDAKNFPQTHAQYWASGTSTHRQLAEAGFWIQGDNDFRGQNFLSEWLQSNFYQAYEAQQKPSDQVRKIYRLSKKSTSHSKTIPGEQLIHCYETVARPLSAKELEDLTKVQVFFWTSPGEIAFYSNKIIAEIGTIAWQQKIHCCAPGKTATYLQNEGITPHLFYQVSHFLDSIKYLLAHN